MAEDIQPPYRLFRMELVRFCEPSTRLYGITSAVLFQLYVSLHWPWHVFFLQGEGSQFPVTTVSSVSWLLWDWVPLEKETSDGLWHCATICSFCGDPTHTYCCSAGIKRTFCTTTPIAINYLYICVGVNIVWYLVMFLLCEMFSFLERQNLLVMLQWLYACSLCAT